jgi:hypothetical protein
MISRIKRSPIAYNRKTDASLGLAADHNDDGEDSYSNKNDSYNDHEEAFLWCGGRPVA